jgi:FtsP/CotA-like multicopper oxidase with cupredoxin domain
MYVVFLMLPSQHLVSLQWHGIHQFNSPWSDGVPGVTQRLIEDGETFVYKFDVDQVRWNNLDWLP